FRTRNQNRDRREAGPWVRLNSFARTAMADTMPESAQPTTRTGESAARPAFLLPAACMPLSISLLLPHKRRHPIGFPGLAAIEGECLFQARGVGGGDPHVAHKNVFAIEVFLVKELAAAVFVEFAHGGGERDDAIGLVRPVDAPLVRFGVVGSNRQAFDVAEG